MSRLEIDLGNSRAKWRLPALSLSGNLPSNALTAADELPPEWAGLQVTSIWLGSVLAEADTESAIAKLQRFFACDVHRAYSSPAAPGLINGYAEPSRLGVDRWLALLAARQHRGGDLVVVDAGTAITLDLVRADGTHLGGYILPGVARQAQSLWGGTGRVQVERAAMQPRFTPGQTTQECVAAAITAAIAGLCLLARQSLPEAAWCLTGGDADWLAAICGELHLSHAFYPDLVLDGLAWAQMQVYPAPQLN
ncbi:MAG TPA: type III pantothenate kinase [Cellvibrionaceae bacterium]|nr:type III pantothenate kinase [Cellvibrionaceae bacterium]HMW48296.1 type III pantothenate kinase [Cellvibrionaceae bacterium]HMW72387.1 type III pantothenate kinase [Cellvibrionaceae bacterium]HMY38631.1 type III pantothenate kinase [Marinagarivorans sp.]HNG60912.1 type III pantothenate kinase [Cellvibrionaceae bacterium]